MSCFNDAECPTLIDQDTRRPVAGHCHYRGFVNIDPYTPMGPKEGTGEVLWPVTAEYCVEEDRTRVGFAYFGPPDPSKPGSFLKLDLDQQSQSLLDFLAAGGNALDGIEWGEPNG